MTDKMVLYHKREDKTRRRAKRKELLQKIPNKISEFRDYVEKYPAWTTAIISAIAGSLFTFFLSNIGAILNWFFKQAG